MTGRRCGRRRLFDFGAAAGSAGDRFRSAVHRAGVGKNYDNLDFIGVSSGGESPVGVAIKE